MRIIVTLLMAGGLVACALNSPVENKPVPERSDKSSGNQLAKGDFDRMTDVEISENMQSLRHLMIKLYKRNPHELAKSTSDNAEKMAIWVIDGEQQHHNLFKEIDNKQGTEAIFLAFKPEYSGDRVLPFIVGLQTMLLQAHDGKRDFYLTDTVNPQHIYNVARNIEIAAWKLSNARDEAGTLYLLSNEINDKDRNLSFEREFGKMIGRTDLYAITLAEKSERLIARVMQNLATAIFLPF
ncbi:MAG: hypothetical protein EXR38_02650 [Methylotenera sp.]|nr:hypothetical protein [Methylotenera sp.]MSP99393.1 hypothetical protein [Methylotenera sp.]